MSAAHSLHLFCLSFCSVSTSTVPDMYSVDICQMNEHGPCRDASWPHWTRTLNHSKPPDHTFLPEYSDLFLPRPLASSSFSGNSFSALCTFPFFHQSLRHWFLFLSRFNPRSSSRLCSCYVNSSTPMVLIATCNDRNDNG